MLKLMNESQETMESGVSREWSAAAKSFIEATSWASLGELCEVSTHGSAIEHRLRQVGKHTFLNGSNGPEILTALCFASNLMLHRSVEPLEAYSKRLD